MHVYAPLQRIYPRVELGLRQKNASHANAAFFLAPVETLALVERDSPIPSEPASQNAFGNSTADPTLASLLPNEAAKSAALPRLIVGHYSKAQGLLAAYDSETGKRILFRAHFRLDGGMSTQILHRDTATGKIEHLVEKSKALDEAGQPVRDVAVGGIDMRAFMESGRRKDKGHAEKELKLKAFVDSEAGQALLDAVPALYASLDMIEQEPEVARLVEPFGAAALALQLNAKHFRGFKHADKILGTNKAKELRDTCGTDTDCALRGKRFMVHSFGLFDPLSKDFKKAVKKNTPQPSGLAELNGLTQPTSV